MSELTRRAGGGHGQRQKRGWGAKQQSPPSCTRGLAATSTYEVNIEGTLREGGVFTLPSIDLVLVGVSTLRLAHRKLLRVLLLVSRSASKGPGAASRVTNLFEHAQREQLPLTIRSSDSVEPAAPQDNPRHRPTRTGDADAHTTKHRSRSTTHVNSRWHPSRLRRRPRGGTCD